LGAGREALDHCGVEVCSAAADTWSRNDSVVALVSQAYLKLGLRLA